MFFLGFLGVFLQKSGVLVGPVVFAALFWCCFAGWMQVFGSSAAVPRFFWGLLGFWGGWL